MAHVEVRREYAFPVRRYDFPVENGKPLSEEERRPNFNVPRLVDGAITDGRIARDERERWLRAFEDSPYSARRSLTEKQSDQLRAAQNFFADPTNERAYRAHHFASFGGEPRA